MEPARNLKAKEAAQNKMGRPPMFESAEALQASVDEYFQWGVRTKPVVVGKGDAQKVVDVPIPTISGLCYFLGFESRQSFYDYGEKPEFTYTIKRARLFIETEYEMQLNAGNTVGAIFALKNMGWIDKIANDVTTNGESINTPPTSIVFKSFSAETPSDVGSIDKP